MKLIRDDTPGLLENSTTTARDDREFELLLRQKLMEEAAEISAATSDEEFLSECGDLLEVFETLIQLKGLTLGQVVDAQVANFRRKGGFENRVILLYDPPNNKHK